MKTAKIIKDNLDGFGGRAALYRLSKPISSWEYVIVSGVVQPHNGRPVVTVFPSNKHAEIVEWNDILKKDGTVDHKEVLGEFGYTITE